MCILFEDVGDKMAVYLIEQLRSEKSSFNSKYTEEMHLPSLIITCWDYEMWSSVK